MRYLGILLTSLAAVLVCAVPLAAPVALMAPVSAAVPTPAAVPRNASAPAFKVAAHSALGDGWAARPTYKTSDGPQQIDCLSAVPVCIHYVTTGVDKVTSSFLAGVVSTMTYVYTSYQKSGYRMPESDGTKGALGSGGTKGQIDIYLWDMDSHNMKGYYGYCTPAKPGSGVKHSKVSTSAFCVLDNDYVGYTTGKESAADILHVTLAHEFFHAVQFGYDAAADSWLMEATATWAEDQLYSGVNDNRQYLPYGPIGRPRYPMDDQSGTYASGDPSFTVYGDWLFFRFLTEAHPTKSGPLPVLVRRIWQASDSIGHTSKTSTAAIKSALKKAGTTWAKAWGAFTAANRHPATAYQEGKAYHAAKPTAHIKLTKSKKSAKGSFSVKHLSSASERITPSHVSGQWKLRLTAKVTSSRESVATAWAVVWRTDGKVSQKRIVFHKGLAKKQWTIKGVKRIDLVLGDASVHYTCHTGNVYTCDGTPAAPLKVSWTATVKKP